MKKNLFYSIAAVTLVLGGLNMASIFGYQKTTGASLFKSAEALTQQESNNNGSGMFFYEHLQGRPAECTLYKAVSASGEVEWSDTKISGKSGWTITSIRGLKELCPNTGSGCTAYSCRTT